MRTLALLLALGAAGFQSAGPGWCCISWTESGCTCCGPAAAHAPETATTRKACCPKCRREAPETPPKKAACAKGHGHGLKPASDSAHGLDATPPVARAPSPLPAPAAPDATPSTGARRGAVAQVETPLRI